MITQNCTLVSFCLLLVFVACSQPKQKFDEVVEVKEPKPEKKVMPNSPFNFAYEEIDEAGNVYYEISEINFTYNKELHSIKHSTFFFDSTEFENPKIYFKDFNFDGFKDVMIYKIESGVRNYMFDKYLYNPKTNSFVYHSKLSTLINCQVDTINKVLTSTFYDGQGGITIREKYKWGKDSLLLLD